MKQWAWRLAAACLILLGIFQPAAAAIPEQLIPMGKTVGIELETDGLLVVGFQSDEAAAKRAGLKKGDLIQAVNGETVHSTEALKAILEREAPERLRITAKRRGKTVEVLIDRNVMEQAGKLGLFLRDRMAGIGTLTYYDPETKTFGALGHGVEDSETGTLLPMKQGRSPPSQVAEVQKGQRGAPGALKGLFNTRQTLGYLSRNTEHGLFGVSAALHAEAEPVSLAAEKDVHPGAATILANVSGDKTEEFSVEITKVFPGEKANGRNMLLTVTDPRLLATTGGIVQGMSGSPILQDGKLAGAVTHVLVNDPTAGYGIFIENMLDAAA